MADVLKQLSTAVQAKKVKLGKTTYIWKKNTKRRIEVNYIIAAKYRITRNGRSILARMGVIERFPYAISIIGGVFQE